MTQRSHAADEVDILWQATFGDAPAIVADTTLTLTILVKCLPDPGPWRLDRSVEAVQEQCC